MTNFVQSLFIGFMIAAPVGPIGLLCIQRTIVSGWRLGIFTGLGAASADLVYGLVGAMGFAAVISFLVASKLWLSLAGGAILIYLGLSAMKSQTVRSQRPTKEYSSVKTYLTTFLLTLSNPMTIFAFIAVFSTIGADQLTSEKNNVSVLVIICIGIFLGSIAWWIVLTFTAHHLSSRLNQSRTMLIGRGGGACIALFGCYTIITAFTKAV